MKQFENSVSCAPRFQKVLADYRSSFPLSEFWCTRHAILLLFLDQQVFFRNNGSTSYETILAQPEAEKLSADVVDSRVTTAIQTYAEKEFEAQFSSVCSVVQEPIKVNSNGMNSPFLKKIIEKNRKFIAYETTEQTSENNILAPKSEENGVKVVQKKTTTKGD